MLKTNSQRKLLLQYHMLFCGGTSLFGAAKQTLGGQVQSISRFYGRWVAPDFKPAPNTRYIRQHYPINLIPQLGDADLLVVIPVRDPVSYVRSTYTKPATYPGKIMSPYPAIHKVSITDYMLHITKHHMENPFCRQIALLHPTLAEENQRYLHRYRREKKIHNYSNREMMRLRYEDQMPYVALTRHLSAENLLELAMEVSSMPNFSVFPVSQLQRVVSERIGPHLGVDFGTLSRVGKSVETYEISDKDAALILKTNSSDTALLENLTATV